MGAKSSVVLCPPVDPGKATVRRREKVPCDGIQVAQGEIHAPGPEREGPPPPPPCVVGYRCVCMDRDRKAKDGDAKQ